MLKYASNGKEILVMTADGPDHFGDAFSEDSASQIADALNTIHNMPTPFDYISEARLTCSPSWHGEKVSKVNFVKILNGAIEAANQLDKVKKTLFYGRDNNLDPLEGQASVARLPEVFGLNAHIETHVDVMHGIIGLFTEAGELLEAMRSAINENRPFDFVNLKEEVGDSFWYQAIIAFRSGFSFEDAMRVNIAKLRARFPDAFTEFDANNRELGVERAILEGGNVGVSLGVDPVLDVDQPGEFVSIPAARFEEIKHLLEAGTQAHGDEFYGPILNILDGQPLPAPLDITDQALPLHHRTARMEGERNLDGDAIEAQKPR